MLLDEVLREEALRRGYPERVIEESLTFARVLVVAGVRLDNELDEVEEARVRRLFAEVEANPGWVTEELVGRN
jgi:hypothetical protein